MKLALRTSVVFPLFLLMSLIPGLASAQHYVQTNLDEDTPNTTPPPAQDANLVNPWGLARSSTSPWWVADNGSSKLTLYNGSGTAQAMVVSVPVNPTGIVFNGVSTDFVLSNGKAATFIFVTENGVIGGWNTDGSSITVKDNSGSHAVYKGAAIGVINGAQFLFVNNFHSGQIEVYDHTFSAAQLPANAFHNNHAPAGFAPFGIQSLGGNLVITYAKQDAAKHDDVAGAGNGFVDVFSTSGALLSRMEHGSWLNSPWGVALAPRDFGVLSNHLLIGNFGSGQIASFDPFTGSFTGLLETSDTTKSAPLVIDGLWALEFGSAGTNAGTGNAGPYNSLFFTAGPGGEMHGLFGTLTPVASEKNADE